MSKLSTYPLTHLSTAGKPLAVINEKLYIALRMEIFEYRKLRRLGVALATFVVLGATLLVATHSHDDVGDNENAHCAICRTIHHEIAAPDAATEKVMAVAIDWLDAPTFSVLSSSTFFLPSDPRAPPQA